MYKVLVCDDEKDIVSAISIYLTSDGYEVIPARNGLEALDIVKHNDVHLVLMDIMMPVMDGIEAMVEIRKISNVPVILLTAKSEDTDKVLGLTVGADDYVTKPFSPSVLMKRVAALLRRAQAPDAGDSMHMDELCINEEAHEVTLHGKPLELTLKEYNLLRKLMASPGRVYTREQLLDSIWGIDYVGDIRTVDSHMARLRTKLGEWGGAHLKTVYGMGYKIEGQI